jgi:hypothetical protein
MQKIEHNAVLANRSNLLRVFMNRSNNNYEPRTKSMRNFLDLKNTIESRRSQIESVKIKRKK